MVSTSETDSNIRNATTIMSNDAEVVTASFTSETTLPISLKSSTNVGVMDSLKDFLCKPLYLTQVNWNTQPSNTMLYNVDIPDVPFADQLYQTKVLGFLGFRATTVFRIQVNGQKFQQGRLLVHFIPQAGVVGVNPGYRNRSLVAKTQQPRVELDLSTDTEAVLEVPYVSPNPYYNIQDGSGMIGRFYVSVYSPLRTGTGSNNATISMWVNFKDVELVTPTFPHVQMAGGVKGSNISEQENKSTMTPLSSQNLTNTIVSTLTSIVGMPAWAEAAAKGAARAMGYSAPNTETTSSKVTTRLGNTLAVCDLADNSAKVSLSGCNKLAAMDSFAGTNIDECALSHLFSIPSFYTSIEFTLANAVGDVLHANNVEPCSYQQSLSILEPVTGYTANYKDKSPLCYFSNFFRYWRGSIKIRMKAVKTDFHSGRLLVCYTPGSVTTPTLDQTDFLLREIVDLREKSEWEFTLPFASTRQYHTVGYADTTAPADPVGKFYIFVLNTLQAPDTCSGNVQILLEASGGDDFEVAVPQPLTQSGGEWVVPYSNSTWSSAQMASVDHSAYCMGESVKSLYQLLKRDVPAAAIANGTGTYALGPFYLNSLSASSGTSLTLQFIQDYFNAFSQCFMYSRGGVRIKIRRLSAQSVQYDMRVTYNPQPGNFGSTTNSTIIALVSAPGTAQVLGAQGQRTFLDVEIPGYAPNFMRLNRTATDNSNPTVDQYTPIGHVVVSALTTDSDNIYRSVADDFQLGYFIGTPAVFINDFN